MDGWLGYVISFCIEHFVLHLLSGDGIGGGVNGNITVHLLTQNANNRDWKGILEIHVVLFVHSLITLSNSLYHDTLCSGLAGGI